MKTESERQLERFIDVELKRVPDLKAPTSLLPNIIKEIEGGTRNWVQMSWLCWPMAAKAVSVVIFAGLAALSFHGLAELVFAPDLAVIASRLSTFINTISTLVRAVMILTRPLQNQWLLWNFVALGLMVSAIIAVSRALLPSILKREQ